MKPWVGSRIIRDEVKIDQFILRDDGTFPNNESLPVVLYRQGLVLPDRDPACEIEHLVHHHGWDNSWRNGIYLFHHYHSTAHELLAVYAGRARVQLGGPSGPVEELSLGDVIIIPAGVAHKNLGSSPDFAVVGSYPDGQEWDLLEGSPDERPRADQNIGQVPLPRRDPLFGAHGPLLELWSPAENRSLPRTQRSTRPANRFR